MLEIAAAFFCAGCFALEVFGFGLDAGESCGALCFLLAKGL